jgi:hypothetical protein
MCRIRDGTARPPVPSARLPVAPAIRTVIYSWPASADSAERLFLTALAAAA